MKPQSDFVVRMKLQLKAWDDDVALLTEKAKTASSEARDRYDTEVTKLLASRAAAQESFRQICIASESAAVQLHAGMEAAWALMQAGLEKASADIRSQIPSYGRSTS
jgi:hypothetical protein